MKRLQAWVPPIMLALLALGVTVIYGIAYRQSAESYSTALASLENEAKVIIEAREDELFSTTLGYLDRKVHDDLLSPPWLDEMRAHRRTMDKMMTKWWYSREDWNEIEKVGGWMEQRRPLILVNTDLVRRARGTRR